MAVMHVLAIQDTSALRVDEKGVGLSFHLVIAVDANAGTVLGLVDNFFLTRQGGERDKRKQRAFAEKDSRRWLKGAEAASALAEAGAACATVIEDREGDIYECFAFKPAAVEKLVRAAQDRRLADGTTLFSKIDAWDDAWDEAGAMTVELAAAPGRAARKAELSVKFGKVEILRPNRHSDASGLPKTIGVTLVIGREINPLEGEEPALWLLLCLVPAKVGIGLIAAAAEVVRQRASSTRLAVFSRLRARPSLIASRSRPSRSTCGFTPCRDSNETFHAASLLCGSCNNKAPREAKTSFVNG